VIQLQQPVAAALTAIDLAGPRRRIILDGAPQGDDRDRDRLLRATTMLRCDAREAELIASRAVPDAAAGRAVARELLHDDDPAQAIHLATAAAGMSVGHLAGRPGLDPDRIRSLPGRPVDTAR